ncbi:MAG: hypothetical protein O9306_13750 [Beijerinckiaceae bacterium]|nr:hypothetical protein [Beijerinckiaceae bacterium]
MALVTWFAALLAMPLASEATRNVTLVAVSEAVALRAITYADVDILDGSGRIFRVRGRAPDFLWKLYASGGVIVLAGNGGGCGIARQR